MKCLFFFHDWSLWFLLGTFKSYGRLERNIGTRYCLKCNKAQMKCSSYKYNASDEKYLNTKFEEMFKKE